MAGFAPDGVPPGSKAAYDLSLSLDLEGKFSAKANIEVENTSADTWDKLVFYMIPNVFTGAGKLTNGKQPGSLTMLDIEVGGSAVDFTLAGDTLELRLPNKMAPGQKAEVAIAFTFTVPEQGIRYTRSHGTYYLAQCYPMLATYQNGGWNKQAYTSLSESYFTAHSDYKLSYTLPDGYQLISSADDPADSAPSAVTGERTVKQVKELFVAVTGDRHYVSETVDGVDIRVWGRPEQQQDMSASLEWAVQAFSYYNKALGKYPLAQLDLMLDDVVWM